jgi:hypothetical protein
MILFADLTATATLILAGITLGLAVATVALVLVTRAGTAQARADARAELSVLKRQVGSGYRPLLVEVIATAPVPADMGALYNQTHSQGPNANAHEPGPVIETKLPGMEPRLFDPRAAFVLFQAGKIYLSVPLRNVGRGLALIDGGGVDLTGPMVGSLEYRTIQRAHVPVGETTRIDLITVYLKQKASDLAEPGRTMRGITWQVLVPYLDFAGEQRSVVRLQIICTGDDVNGPWLVERADQESPADQKAPRDEVPAGPRGRNRRGLGAQPVTDLWGNAPRPRRRTS